MFEKFTANGGNTFRQRYEGTFGYYVNRETKTPPLLVQLTNFRNDGNILEFKTIDGVLYTLNINTNREIGFEFAPPTKRWYPSDRFGALLGSRRVARQFSRGLCENNYELRYLQNNERWVSAQITFENVHHILEESTRQITAPVTAFVENKYAHNTYYLTPQYVLFRSKEGLLNLYLYERPIASLTVALKEKQLKVTGLDMMFMREVHELLAKVFSSKESWEIIYD